MPDFQKCDISRQQTFVEDLALARQMTFPAYRQLLEGASGHDILIARQNGEMRGLAIWHVGDPGRRRLLSIFTAPQWRRRGVARALMRHAQDLYHSSGQCALSAWWSNALPGAEAFGQLITTLGWSPPTLDCIRVSAIAGTVKDWSDRRRMERMLARPGLRFREFATVDRSERAAIDSLMEANAVPARWRPFDTMEKVNPALSLLMYHNDRLDGWVVTMNGGPGEVWFHSLYNMGISTHAGALMPLLVEVCRRHYIEHGPQGRWRYNTGPEHPGMVAFLERHASEFADFHDRHLYSTLAVAA